MEEKNRIMVVDDEKSNLIYLNHLLNAEYTVYSVRNAGEAVERAIEYRPDLILLDIIMPEMSGYDVLSALKESDAVKDIPVIFITGLSGTEDEMKGLALGVEDYITKPFNDAIVQLRVRNQIKMVNQMRRIEYLSMSDQLTDIANRRSFDQRMDMEWRTAIRTRSPLSLMMIDIDNFKTYNDTYGHQQGDTVLCTVAGILKRSLERSTDFAARWGGEEFAVLLSVMDMNGALTIAESLRESIERTVIPCPDGTTTGVTISIGLHSKIPSQNESMDDFISKADKALYTAKETGRNRVCGVDLT